MKAIVAIMAAMAISAGASDFKSYCSFIERWEGRSATAYPDPDGRGWVVGVGHYSTTKPPKSLTNKQIDNLLLADTVAAYVSARKLVKTFDAQPVEVKRILVDLCFNLGEGGFAKFKDTIHFCNQHDYKKMGYALKDSRWYTQTGKRAKNHVDTLVKIK